jgi:transcriptional regulator with XRE-family HTH domain
MAGRKRPAGAAQESLGDRIRRHRLSKGLTQTELGQRIGRSQRVIAYYEQRGSSPPPGVLVKIADVLDVSTDVLLGRKRTGRAGDREPARDVRRLRHLSRLDELPINDRKAIFRIIDALADRHRRETSR